MRPSRLLACGAAVVWAVGIAAAPSRTGAGVTDTADFAPVAARAAAGDLDAARVLRAAGPAGLSALLDAGVAEAGHGGAARPPLEARAVDSRALDLRAVDSQVLDPRALDPQALDPRALDPRALDPRALDLVCAQADCASSRLYWYTDFAAARAEAERSGKPILLLRLLGRLDEELSCANSRYFRLVLYSDPAIAGWLREHAVLYWTSERPVPQVTVDFGDGRRLVGTVTGNSIHYLLDAHGRLVDGMPGLHTPKRFLAWLKDAATLAGEWTPLSDRDFAARLRDEHARREVQVIDELLAELEDRGWSERAAREAWGLPPAEPEPEPEAPVGPPPTAAKAAQLALSKSFAEVPILTAMGTSPLPPRSLPAIDALILTSRWNVRLGPETRRLLASRGPGMVDEQDFEAAILRLESRLAEDGLRNEAFLHRAIHARLASAEGLPSWQELNDWVYTTLFLTPASDPWLGLAPTELLGALQPAPH